MRTQPRLDERPKLPAVDSETAAGRPRVAQREVTALGKGSYGRLAGARSNERSRLLLRCRRRVWLDGGGLKLDGYWQRRPLAFQGEFFLAAGDLSRRILASPRRRRASGYKPSSARTWTGAIIVQEEQKQDRNRAQRLKMGPAISAVWPAAAPRGRRCRRL
jgi:hypothetical protein